MKQNNKMIKKIARHQGFTLLETIITVAVLSIGVIGLYVAFSPLIETNYNENLTFKAMYLAQEGIEIAKNIRDNNVKKGVFWSTGLSDCSGGCQADYKTETTAALPVDYLKSYDDNLFLGLDSEGFYSYERRAAQTPYKRKITVTQPLGSDVLKVVVDVFWNYNNKPYSYQTIGYLYRFNP